MSVRLRRLRRAELGITQHHFGPIEHLMGKPYPDIDEKKRVMEDFARRIFV